MRLTHEAVPEPGGDRQLQPGGRLPRASTAPISGMVMLPLVSTE
jgi:hypothetical protein